MTLRPRGVRPEPARTAEDVRAFFDRIASEYADSHGDPGRLLRYRARLLRRWARLDGDELVVEIGCGTGDHILSLAKRCASGVGVDFSSAMIRRARERAPDGKVSFRVDDATRLETFGRAEADVVVCVGSLEHVPDKRAVFAAVRRILKPGGRFVCLTVNGGYLWHRTVAPLLGFGTRHIATDRFLSQAQAAALASSAGFKTVATRFWSFVPRGDVPPGISGLLEAIDVMGRLLGVGAFRGGLLILAEAART